MQTPIQGEIEITQNAISFHKQQGDLDIVSILESELKELKFSLLSFKQRLALTVNKAVKHNQVTYPYGKLRCLRAGRKK